MVRTASAYFAALNCRLLAPGKLKHERMASVRSLLSHAAAVGYVDHCNEHMSGLMPGLDAFWVPLVGSDSLATPVPHQRWDLERLYSPEAPAKVRKQTDIESCRGGDADLLFCRQL